MRATSAPYIAFAGFGIFWGAWGASLPGLRDAAELSDAQLGTALLYVGIGAVPAMALTGRAVDRFGVRVAGLALVALALSGVGLAAWGRDFAALAVGMLLVGATSGAADVGANSLAGLAERRSGRRVITLAHAVFSSFVVVGSLGAGTMTAATGGTVPTFTLAGLLIAASGVWVFRFGTGPLPRHREQPPQERRRLSAVLPFAAVGVVGALGFAAENAHQSWGAVFLTDELQATPLVAAFAPAAFAAFAAVTRFGVGTSTRIPERAILWGGAGTAVIGTVLLAGAPTIPVALAGLAIAAVGTSVLFPTLLSRATRDVTDVARGRATSIIGTTAYLGFVLGPVYVGYLSSSLGLRGALIGVAALCLAFGILAPLPTRKTPSAGPATAPVSQNGAA
ncbi:MFS transporter [Microbacterium sp. P07]|uniref:MFS transporter n=1 Tax=Microbacterium sp. P07 TaxID=3366952 RepID=UPI003745DF5F